MSFDAKTLRFAALKCALNEWQQQIVDTDEPHGDGPISTYFRACGHNWIVEDGYQERSEYWCGAFVGYCYLNVGDYIDRSTCYDVQIDPAIAQSKFLSTERLANLAGAEWEVLGHDSLPTIEPQNAEPGDIVTIDTGRKDGDYGDHIAIVDEAPRNGTYKTIEGNAYGRLPSGDKAEGVVRGARTLEQTAVVYRPQKSHFSGDSV